MQGPRYLTRNSRRTTANARGEGKCQRSSVCREDHDRAVDRRRTGRRRQPARRLLTAVVNTVSISMSLRSITPFGQSDFSASLDTRTERLADSLTNSYHYDPYNRGDRGGFQGNALRAQRPFCGDRRLSTSTVRIFDAKRCCQWCRYSFRPTTLRENDE